MADPANRGRGDSEVVESGAHWRKLRDIRFRTRWSVDGAHQCTRSRRRPREQAGLASGMGRPGNLLTRSEAMNSIDTIMTPAIASLSEAILATDRRHFM